MPEAVYYKNVRGGPIGVLQKALHECLPEWAVMDLSFAGDYIFEVITDRDLKERLIATLAIMAIVVVTDLDITKAPKNLDTSATGSSIKTKNETVTIRRLNYCIENCPNTAENVWDKKN